MYMGSVHVNKRLTRAAGVDKKVGLPRSSGQAQGQVGTVTITGGWGGGGGGGDTHLTQAS